MSRKGAMDWKGFGLLGGILIFLALAWMFTPTVLPTEYEGAENGFRLAQEIIQQHGRAAPGDLIIELLSYVILPFALIFSLIWGVISASGGDHFSRKVNISISIIFSLGAALSSWFVVISAVVFGLGSGILGLIGVFVVALIIWEGFHTQTSETREAIRGANKDLELEEQAREIEEYIEELIQDSKSGSKDVGSEWIALGNEVLTLSRELQNKTLADDIQTRANSTSVSPSSVGGLKKYNREMKGYIESIIQIAHEFQNTID